MTIKPWTPEQTERLVTVAKNLEIHVTVHAEGFAVFYNMESAIVILSVEGGYMINGMGWDDLEPAIKRIQWFFGG